MNLNKSILAPRPTPEVWSKKQPIGIRIFLRPKEFFALLKSTYSEWSKHNATRMGAALAYYTIFSLAPLLVIAIAIAGIAFGAKAAQGQMMGEIQGMIGSDSAKAIQSMIQSAYKPAHSAIASIIGVIALLLGASGTFAEMEEALNTIWDAPPSNKGTVWTLIKSRFLSFGMVLGIGFLLLVSLVISAALAALANYLEGFLSVPAFLLHTIDFVISLIFITALFAMMFKVLPNVRIDWSDVMIGAGLTSLLFGLGKFLIGFYIGKSVSASAYGPAGSLVIVVAWVYYSAMLVYFGAEFTRCFAIQYGSYAAVEQNTHS